MHRMRSSMRQDDLQGGGALFIPNHPFRRPHDGPAAASPHHLATGMLVAHCGATASLAKPCSSQLQHDSMAMVDQDLLGRSASYDLACGMSPDTHALSTACSGLSSPVLGISTPPSNGIDGTLLNHLLLANNSVHVNQQHSSAGLAAAGALSNSSHQQQQQQQQLKQQYQQQLAAAGDWRMLAGDMTPDNGMQQLLAQMPQAQQQQLMLEAMQLSSQPLPATQQQQQLQACTPPEQQWMEQLLAAAAGSPHMSGLDNSPLQPATPNQHDLHCQWPTAAAGTLGSNTPAMLSQQQQLLLMQAAALGSGASMPQPQPATDAAAGTLPGALMLQQMLQAVQAQGQHVQQQSQQLNTALALAALGATGTAAPLSAGQVAQSPTTIGQHLLNSSAAGGIWPQQTLPLINGMAGVNAQLASLTLQNQQLSAQLLTGQIPSVAAPASSAIAQLLSAQLGNLINPSGPAAAAAAATAAGKLWTGVSAALPTAAPGVDAVGGRRSRRNSRNVNTIGTLAPTAAELFARRGRCNSNGKEGRRSSGSEQSMAASAALLPGVQLSDLVPGSFDEYWGACDGLSSDDHRASDASVMSVSTDQTSSSASNSSCSETCRLEQRCGSVASVGSIVLSDDESEQLPASSAACDSWSCQDSWEPAKNGGAAAAASAVSAQEDNGTAGGCPAWFPGAREASGDDSWYLPRPPTSRLFVGNIGCWVDEAMLLSYFGKYGKVVDVQVMWNTKMLARGRRVNREFAFISYSSPLEAARAVHWLDGCRLPDLEKDKNGVTVEYENGESEAAGSSKNVAAASK